MTLAITPLYAAILTLIYVALSLRVVLQRRKVRVGIGDRGDKILARRIRVHGNFAEYVPLALILMLMAELQGTVPRILHVIGGSLVVGRLIHAYGVGREPERLIFRQTGMTLTYLALLAGAAVTVLNSGVFDNLMKV